MSETGQRNVTYIVLAVAVFAAAIAAYSTVSAQSSMASVATQTNSVAQAVSSKINTLAESTSQSENTKEQTITVSGVGSVNLSPDTVFINVGFDTIAPTAQEAVQKNSETMKNIIESLKTLGLDEKDVRTSYFSVYPQYQNDPEGKNPPKITGYQASNSVSIVTKQIDKVAQIIDKAISAGANRVDGPNFSLSAEAQKNLRSDVINKALKDAEETGKTMLASQGLSIKSVKNMSINFGGYPLVYLERAVATSTYGSGVPAQLQAAPFYSPPVLPGEQQVSATAVVTYIVG